MHTDDDNRHWSGSFSFRPFSLSPMPYFLCFCCWCCLDGKSIFFFHSYWSMWHFCTHRRIRYDMNFRQTKIFFYQFFLILFLVCLLAIWPGFHLQISSAFKMECRTRRSIGKLMSWHSSWRMVMECNRNLGIQKSRPNNHVIWRRIRAGSWQFELFLNELWLLGAF